MTPEEIANAIASGNATSPTVTPAMRSDTNFFALYCRRHRIDLGTKASSRTPNSDAKTLDGDLGMLSPTALILQTGYLSDNE